ncbi:putative cell surface protein [Rosellinia necatrix]|uniref:Putative cell surface protein n=1 Tax=Rosellinia necatrix TaxID=77044 RepID=A0A1W2TCX5_ROSNE|nr:putative cell surface protein [Rosellinia necatrix]
MSNIVQKVKDAVSGHHDTSSAPEGTHGPHGSRVANAADPRIDSDRDHRAAPGSTVGGTHDYTSSSNYTHGEGGYGMSGLTGATATHGTHGTSGLTGTHGTHGTSGLTGTHGTHGTSGLTGTHGTHGGLTGTGTHGTSGLTGVTAGYDGTTDTTGSTGREGPHSSNVANKLDPRIDSDRSGKHLGNTAGDQFGSGAEGVHGPHSSRIANTVDPRVDSDRDGSRTAGNTHGSSGTYGTTGAHDTHGTTHGTAQLGGANAPGPAAHTAGPHKSDLLNKADPRVDSDLDGSRTVGGNKTYGANSTLNKDPTDAAQVPPSTLQKTLGKPTIEHGDVHHGRERRHSLKSSQEVYHGL